MADAIQQALQRRIELRKELELIDRFLELHEQLFGEGAHALSSGAHSTPSEATRTPAASARGQAPKVIANVLEEILNQSDKPMTRGQLRMALAARGYDIRSKDPSKYLGTILWRNSDRFINIEGQGYWLKRRELPEGYGTPADDDELFR